MCIRNVTVAGITGALGPAIVEALVEAKFVVQALTRDCNAITPVLPGANIIRVDYTDDVAVEKILRGQDAVVSVLGDTATAAAAQRVLIEASAAAGVKRFIPSEFGSDTTNPRVRAMPFFREKIKHQELLKLLAAAWPDFSYSILITGPFLDWGLSVVPFVVDIGSRTAQLFDGGHVPFSFTRVSTVAIAVVKTLESAESTANKALFVQDGITTQAALVARAEQILGGSSFQVTDINNAVLECDAWQSFYDHGTDPLSWVFNFINLSLWSWNGPRGICQFEATDNELLGLKTLHGDDLLNVVDHEIIHAAAVFADIAAQAKYRTMKESLGESALDQGRSRLIGF